MDPQHPIDIQKFAGKFSQSSNPPSPADIPTTKVAAEILEGIKETQATTIPTSSLSSTGQVVTSDISQVLTDTEKWLLEKNRDDLIQKATIRINNIIELQNSETGARLREKLMDANEWTDFGMASQRILILSRNLVASGEFRQLIAELISFLQQILLYGIEEPKGGPETSEKAPESFAEAVISRPDELKENDQVIPKSQKERVVNQFVKLLNIVKGKEEFQETLDMIVFQINSLTVSEVEIVSSLDEKERRMLEEIKQISRDVGHDVRIFLENFSNCSMDDLIITWDDLTEKMAKDDKARILMQDGMNFLKKCLKDPQYDQNALRPDIEQLMDRFNESSEEYPPRFEQFLNQIRYYFDRMKRDPLTRQLVGDLTSLTTHLFYDKEGNPTLKPELLLDLQKVVPSILRGLRYIKIPDIELHEPGLDFVATNIVINVGELVPHHLRLTMISDIPETTGGTAKNLIEFEMQRIHAEAQNISFSIIKGGIPPLSDTGLAGFRIYEDGMQIGLRLEPMLVPPTENESQKYTAGLKVARCICKLEHFDLNVHGSGHDWMYYLLGPYIRRLVRQKIEESVVNYFMTTDLMTAIPGTETFSPKQPEVESQLSQVAI